MKLPRERTKVRALVERWAARGGSISFTEAVSIYTAGDPRRYHRSIHMTVWRFLKRYGTKSGQPCSRAPWVLNSDLIQVLASV